jgi:pimeloyl-ACP methyl ester carboxylesterase
MRIKSAVPIVLGIAGAMSATLTYRAFRRDMDRAQKRISTGTQVIDTSSGPIEYASIGEGFPLLIIHGAGGGFDQLRGFELEGHWSEQGFRLIFVSRFGYLRTPLPSADASTTAQADAHRALLDALGIDRAGVIAVSAGAPSGLRFCASYPERCAALALLVPAAFVPGEAATAPDAPPLTAFFRDSLLKSDFAFWLAIKLARRTMIENILATPLKVAERASAAEQQRMTEVLMDILPVSQRREGLMNDAAVVAHLEPTDAARIHVPTLLISAEDDLYGTFRSARYLAGQIPGARLVIYPDGGHLWIGHDEEFQKELKNFLLPLIAMRTAAHHRG